MGDNAKGPTQTMPIAGGSGPARQAMMSNGLFPNQQQAYAMSYPAPFGYDQSQYLVPGYQQLAGMSYPGFNSVYDLPTGPYTGTTPLGSNHPFAGDAAAQAIWAANPTMSPYQAVSRYAPSIDYNALLRSGIGGQLGSASREFAQAMMNSPDPVQAELAGRRYRNIYPNLMPTNPVYRSQAYDPATGTAYLQPAEVNALRVAKPGMTGQQIHDLLPAQFQSTATAAQKTAASEARAQAEAAYNISARGSTVGDPALKQALYNARNEEYRALYGPLGHNFAGGVPFNQIGVSQSGGISYLNPSKGGLESAFPFEPQRWTTPSGEKLTQQIPRERPALGALAGYYGPKYAGAYKYGYVDARGAPDHGNIQQTLRAAGWDPAKGTPPVGANPAQQQMLNELAASEERRSPRKYDPSLSVHERNQLMFGDKLGQNSAAKRAAEQARENMPPPIDPKLVAHVQNLQGGGLYGGVIPKQSTDLPPNPWATLKQMGFSVPENVDLSKPTITGQQVQGLGSSPWGGWQSYLRPFSPWPGMMGS